MSKDPPKPKLELVKMDHPPTEGEMAQLRDAVDRMRRNQHLLEAFCREQAKFVRSEYLAYIDVGFKPAQAMQLVAAKLTPPAK